MQSYFNNPELKAEKISHMQAHIDADELIRGSGWDGSRGCAVGCTFDDYDHSKFPELLGIPEWAGWLLDHLHENTTKGYQYKGDPVALAFLKAIKPGSDLTAVEHQIHIFIQRQNLERIEKMAIDAALKSQVVNAIKGVINVQQKAVDFGWDESAKSAAESAARSAANDAIADEFMLLLEAA